MDLEVLEIITNKN